MKIGSRFDVDGHVTGFGNPDWARTHSAATSTAPAVVAILRAGAKCVGKTVMDEMAYRFESIKLPPTYLLYCFKHQNMMVSFVLHCLASEKQLRIF